MASTNCKYSDRGIAVTVLSQVLEEKAFANIALRKALSDSGLEPRSRAFVTDLVNETLRNLIQIDHVINTFSKIKTDKMKPIIRNLLRISVCQLRKMDKIPSHAAINEAVAITRAYGLVNLTGFVNGVLRSIDREKDRPHISEKNLALRYSYPKWLITAIIGWLGADAARDFCESCHQPPPVTIFTNTLKTTPSQLIQKLKSEGVEAAPAEAPVTYPQLLTLRRPGDISRLDAFGKGYFFVTDPGAMLALEFLSPKPGQTIIDMCAAPGGKSFAAACMMENTGQLLAFDIHPHKAELVRQTAKKLGASMITAAVQDALIYNEAMAEKADAVLLDAPCSGLGTIRKHPEIKYNRTKKDISELAEKQGEMLNTAAKYVKTGGRLVYCTCTIAKEENNHNIDRFLESNPGYSLEKAVQTLPGTARDGFFAACITRIF